jgi:hypothetical protein
VTDPPSLDGLARELLVASQALFDAGRAVQRHAPDAGDPPADRRVSDLQRAALAALRSLAGGLDATAESAGASAAQHLSAQADASSMLGYSGRTDG